MFFPELLQRHIDVLRKPGPSADSTRTFEIRATFFPSPRLASIEGGGILKDMAPMKLTNLALIVAFAAGIDRKSVV